MARIEKARRPALALMLALGQSRDEEAVAAMDLLLTAQERLLADPPGPPALVAAVRATRAASEEALSVAELIAAPETSRGAISFWRNSEGRAALFGRQLRLVPAAAERDDQADGGEQALLAGRQQGFFVRQRRRLRRSPRSCKACVPAWYSLRAICTACSAAATALVLHRRFARQNRDRRELVLDLLEGRQHRLAIGGDARLIGGARRLDLRRRQPARRTGVCAAERPNDQAGFGRAEPAVNGLPT